MKKEHVNLYRLIPISCIFASMVILSCVLGLLTGIYPEEAICVAFLDAFFFAILLFELEFDRARGFLSNNIATTFSKVAIGYAISSIIALTFLFCPSFTCPVMLIALFMCALGNEMLGITVGFYFVILGGVIRGFTSYEIMHDCFLVLLSGVFAKGLTVKRFRGYICALIGLSNVLSVMIFSYLQDSHLSATYVIGGVLSGAVTGLAAFEAYHILRKETTKELDNRLWDILSDEYIEVKEVARFYPSDYAHAKKVSAIACDCAKVLGFSESLCAAAGFYYRMGKWLGEPHIQNSVQRGEQLCFPKELLTILYEYNGELKKPSTPASAVIHMIDSLSIKLDAMKQDLNTSTWNRQMFIYQSLNELSSQGFYDESGLSMNQFLKVREFLVKEERL